MHTGLEETVSVYPAPESTGRKLWCYRQSFDGKINSRFLRHQVDISENRDPRNEVFENLSAPTCLRAGVVTLPLLKSKAKEELDQIGKKKTGTSEGVVIMVAPSQTQRILPALLNSRCPVAPFPVGALVCKEEVAGDVGTDKINGLFLEIQCMRHSFSVMAKISFPRSPQFARL